MPLKEWSRGLLPSENRLYQSTGINFTSWTIVPSRTRQRKFQPGPITTNRPPDVVPATVRFRSPQIAILTGIGTLNHPPVTQPQSLIEHIHALPDTDQWASQQIEVTDEGQDLAHGITDGTATAISDGSFKKGYGTSCSILRGSTITTRIISINTVPGPTDSQSAYRSELAGISGSLLIIQAICNMHHIQNGCITIGLDGQSAMKSVSQNNNPNHSNPTLIFFVTLEPNFSDYLSQSNGPGSKATKMITYHLLGYPQLHKITLLPTTSPKHTSNT